MSRGSYARRTEVRRDEKRARNQTDRPCGDCYESDLRDDDEPQGPFLRRKQPRNESSLWALRMRAIVMEGRRKGLMKGGAMLRVLDDWEE